MAQMVKTYYGRIGIRFSIQAGAVLGDRLHETMPIRGPFHLPEDEFASRDIQVSIMYYANLEHHEDRKECFYLNTNVPSSSRAWTKCTDLRCLKIYFLNKASLFQTRFYFN